MTTYTREMLVKEALSNLMVDGGAGQEPDAGDVEYVDQRVDWVLGELETRGIVSVPDVEDIEPAHFGALAELLADACARKFGKPKLPKVERLDIEDRLQVMVNKGLDGLKLKVDPALQSGGYGLSLARWTRGG